MNKISAKIVADSINPQGDRITSYILTYPRFIHAELMTHRMFSRNSASSRAIPFKKMMQSVQEDPFIPIAWQKDHSGMQGTEYFTDIEEINRLIESWKFSSRVAVSHAKTGNSMGITKQLCNRLLEPFLWHTVLVTATEYENFFDLRCPKYINEHENGEDISFSRKDFINKLKERYPDNWESDLKDFHGIENNEAWEWARLSKSGAEIHIQALAEAMWDAMKESTPKQLKEGQWHIPFGDNIDEESVNELVGEYIGGIRHVQYKHIEQVYLKVSVARCARISYMTFDGKIDYVKDIAMHDSLLANKHNSPFEHCAKAMTDLEYYSFIKGQVPSTSDDWGILNYEYYPLFTSEDSSEWFAQSKGENKNNGNRYGWCNNFKGFIPYRYLIEEKYKL